MPPELLGGEAKASDGKGKTVDRCEWFPSNLTDGESATFRLMGHYGTGHALLAWRWPQETEGSDGLRFAGFGWQTTYPEQPENIARLTDWSKPDRPKIDGEFCKPKRCLAWTAYSVEQDKVVVLLIEQMGLKQQLTEILQDGEDFTFDDDGHAEFVLKFSRKGAGLETTYSVLPKPKKATKAEIAAFDAVRDTALVTKFLSGGHPFVNSERPTFSSKVASATSMADGYDDKGGTDAFDF